MFSQQLLLFVPTAFLLALAPGPDNLGVLSLGVSTGRRAAIGFALGCATGCLNHTILAAAGVSAVLAASPFALKLTQWAGAAYLCWIGIQTLRQVFSAQHLKSVERVECNTDNFRLHFKRGLIANAINPKVAIFFLAFLPQFISPSGWPTWAQLTTLGVVFAACSCLVFVTIALGAHWIGAKLRSKPLIQQLLDGATAVLFLGLAIRLAIADIQITAGAKPS